MIPFYDDVDERALLRDVYPHLQDEESRKIYLARSMHSLTTDWEVLRPVVRNMVMGKVLRKAFEEHQAQDWVLFGAGRWGQAILHYFPEIPWKCIVDNFKAGQTIGDLPILSLDEMKQRVANPYIVNALQLAYAEIEKQLEDAGIREDQVLALGRIAAEHQYFDLPELPHDPEEVFVDVGAFDGVTSCAFARWARTYAHIYAFEPMPSLQEKCRQNFQGLSDVTICPYGLWSKRETRWFQAEGEGSNCRGETDAHGGGARVEVVPLDEVLGGKRVTFLKMDIEGAELEALRGAEHIIRVQQPKLAISVYHRRDDIWRIPMLLLSYVPSYRFYLRVYSFTGKDTVLYAIP